MLKSVFAIEEINKINSQEIIIVNNSTKEFLSILPEYGGRLKEVWLNNGCENKSIIKRVERVNSTVRDDIFLNAKLSPFAGRIKEGKYSFDDHEYNLDLNYPEEGNACHGFMFDKRFRVKDKIISEESAFCRLEYLYKGEYRGYPFRYSIELTYKITIGGEVICETKVVNQSERTIPLSDGWHHYFDLNTKVDDLKLKFEVEEIINLDERKIPTGIVEPFNEFKKATRIGSKHFDSCFKIKNDNGKAVTEIISETQNTHLKIWQETGINKYNYLVIYTPSDRRAIAIEPITSNINAFNSREDLILLGEGKEYQSSFGISLNNAKS